MDYFRIFNLTREPFSNSPEPGFFFPSTKHLSCLQQLEVSVRLRRGLNVVMGDVGAGKTTLCREMILKFTESEEDRQDVQTHLLLDPAFSSPREFLSTVALSFGLPAPGLDESEWQLKESIKNDLLHKGVDEKKIVVLIIDEGQKLPEFCLEILREFLNYETNEYKLLQIVIFAQNEFRELLKTHPYFSDRINLWYDLKPLNFREMNAMIRFRLERAGWPAEDPHAFSLPALWAVYRATGGYPRKVVTLCHQVILALIIKQQKTAGWSLVRSCAERTPVHQIARFKQKPLRWAAASAAAVLLALFVTGVIAPDRIGMGSFFKKGSFTENKKVETPASVSMASVQPVSQPSRQETEDKPIKAVLEPGRKMPKLLGKVTVHRNDTIYWVFRRVYEDFNLNERQIQEVRDANPHIKNLDFIRPGEVVNIPAIPAMSNPLPTGKGHFWVQVARSGDLDEAHKILINPPGGLPPARLFSYWNGREGSVFTVLLKRDFTHKDSALDAIKHLPPSFTAKARVMNEWDKDTVFFAFR